MRRSASHSALAAAITTYFYVPLWGTQALFSFEGDAVVVLYLLTIPTLCFFLGGWYSTSLFAAIGSVRTLTLVDGKRFVPSTTQGTVDVNLIPSILVSRTEVVTGGASGLGAATAEALHAEGVKIALFDMNAEKGEALAKKLVAWADVLAALRLPRAVPGIDLASAMRTDAPPAIVLDKVNKWYGNNFHVLRDIDLTVARGERMQIEHDAVLVRPHRLE